MNKYRHLVIVEECCGRGGPLSDDELEFASDADAMSFVVVQPKVPKHKHYLYRWNGSAWVLIYQ